MLGPYQRTVWWLAVLLVRVASDEEPEKAPANDDCAGGFCQNGPPSVGNCGFWIGPSPIKSKEEHGFGLGAFTGKFIPKGATIEGMFYGSDDPTIGEINVPLYANEELIERHTPLFDNVWDEANMPLVAMNYPEDTTTHFFPSLAAFAPCTESNYNLIMVGKGSRASFGRQATLVDAGDVHRSKDPTAGSFSYYPHVQYEAVRDIAPGEELTVECDDNAFDGGNYYLSRYDDSDKAVSCIDRYVRVGNSPGLGRGLFAKRQIATGTSILSTPLIPVARKDMYINDQEIANKQLLLNYCYGHPDSDVLLLPSGPMVNYINHNDKKPNAKIRWHETTLSKEELAKLERREEYHHFDEMKEWTAEQVVNQHGMGLIIDIVATRPIEEGEEIFLHYGNNWQAAWDVHRMRWRPHDPNYINADMYAKRRGGRNLIRSIPEQATDPYPTNIDTYCWYTSGDGQDDDEDTTEISPDVFFVPFNEDADNACVRPCRVIERTSNEGEVEALYTVELDADDNSDVPMRCAIHRDTFVVDMPEWAIVLLDRPRTSDMMLKEAFRHEIGVPDGFFPDAWLKRRNGRLGRSNNAPPVEIKGEEFKRKGNLPMTKKIGNATKTSYA